MVVERDLQHGGKKGLIVQWGEIVQQGWLGLRAHKLRSILTALGIIFGVAAVIAMLGIGEGAKRSALAQYKDLGIDNVLVLSRALPADASTQENRSLGLSRADAWAVARIHPRAVHVAGVCMKEEEVQSRGQQVKAAIVGTTPAYPEIMPVHLAEGRWFQYHESDRRARVCILGGGISHELFPLRSSVGQRIKIDRDWFSIIGRTEIGGPAAKDDSGAVRDTGNDIYLPLSTCFARFGINPKESELSRIIIRMDTGEGIDDSARLVQTILDRRHGTAADFRVVVPRDLIRRRQATARIFNLVMGAIAGISLLVGGIGIMNIMLASVLERTREIGIRRAVGATRREVMWQFLTEAILVSLLGGVLGVVLGIALTRAIAVTAGWTTVVSLPSVILAFSISTLIGVVFGWVPARRAALLSPIECLRYE